MQPIEVQSALAAAVEEVLETMCFTGVMSSSESAIAEPAGLEPAGLEPVGVEPVGVEPVVCDSLIASLRFEGNLCGEFRLRMPMKVARVVGSGFLGFDESEISDSQAGEVVCELANMYCGSALSRLEADTIFHLSHPEMVCVDAGVPFGGAGFCRWFELEEGNLATSLNVLQAI